MMIQPIVEGHGEVKAARVLLRRLIREVNAWDIDIDRPIRCNRNKLTKRPELEKAVGLARIRPDCSAILIMFDGDRDCPAELGPNVQRWAAAVAGGIPCEVVLPHREYEAWFLAAIESLRGQRGIRPDAMPHPEPETPRGAKEQLEAKMQRGRSYMETTDQPAFSASFSFATAYARCRSFRRMTRAFGALLRAMGRGVAPWPPPAWREDV